MKETRNNCFDTLLLHFGTCAYLFSPEEGSCYVFLTRNNCCGFLASDGVIFQSVIKSAIEQIRLLTWDNMKLCTAKVCFITYLREKLWQASLLVKLWCNLSPNLTGCHQNLQNSFLRQGEILYCCKCLLNKYRRVIVIAVQWKVFRNRLVERKENLYFKRFVYHIFFDLVQWFYENRNNKASESF